MMIPAMILVLWCTRQLAFSLPAVALAIWIWNLYVFQSKCLDIWIWKCFEIKIDNKKQDKQQTLGSEVTLAVVIIQRSTQRPEKGD